MTNEKYFNNVDRKNVKDVVCNSVNVALTKSNATRGEYPVGVSWHKGLRSFVAQAKLNSHHQTHLGYFKTAEEAFHVYKEAK